MGARYTFSFLLSALLRISTAQVLVDSIPYPGISQGFWGIHVTEDTLFLADDFSGDIYFSDHDGTSLGQLTTPYDFAHGLIVRPDEYWIAEDYAGDGALLYRIDLQGNAIGSWPFPDVVGGPSSGIGDICSDGDAVWYTMYYPDFDAYPYAYAYKWNPGDAAPIDTIPMNGSQPYGIALKGDTLLYVTDNLDGEPERIYAYDLTNEQDLGYVDLPDMATDGDQSPRGMHYDGEHLYLVANRQGGNAFAYQTVFIYAFDDPTFVQDNTDPAPFRIFPSPVCDVVRLEGLGPGTLVRIQDGSGRLLRTARSGGITLGIPIADLPPGWYTATCFPEAGGSMVRPFLVAR